MCIDFDDKRIKSIEERLSNILDKSDYMELNSLLDSLQLPVLDNLRERLLPEIEKHYRPLIERYLRLENFSVAMRYWPQSGQTELTPKMEFDMSVIDEIVWGLEGHRGRFSHKAAYLAYLKSELKDLEGLLSADHGNYMGVFCLAWHLLQILPSIIQGVEKEVADPLITKYIGRIKFELQSLHLSMLLGLMKEENVISSEISKDALARFAHDKFYLATGEGPGIVSVKVGMTKVYSTSEEANIAMQLGRDFFIALRELDPNKNNYDSRKLKSHKQS